MSRVLVLDDDPQIVRTLELMLRHDGHEVLTASSGELALERLEIEAVDIALVDLQLPGMSGTEVLRKLRDTHRDVETVIITAYGSIETAVEAMKEGAFDYLTKPFSPDQVRHRLRQIYRMKHLEREVAGLQRRVGDLPYGGQFVTQNPQTLHLLEVARDVARSDATVLITGESGTGKTLLARLIHRSSRRHEGPFVTVDCTSFHESLLESELFGHRRGAFTGAVADKVGKIETASGGTLFLDEIGELGPSPQAKLLRFVEERTYERLGDPRPLSIDTRIVAATNRHLEDMVREKSFRRDLFFRLSVVDLLIPALRHRPEDVLLLAADFLTSFSRAHEKNVSDWDEEVGRAMVRYSWPGNVRELANAVERAVLVAPGRTLRLEHFPPRLREERNVQEGSGDDVLSLAELEERHLRKALSHGLSQEETARRLGIDPSTLWRKRKKYGL
jgi:NtrC-family two-component system response regulator AlgB